jgi:hypothetical protein
MQSDSEHSEYPENDLSVQTQSEDTATEEPSQLVDNQEQSAPLTGYELVADMLRRQDEVIVELDALNLRIESAIKEISDARTLDEQAAAGVMAEQDVAEVPSMDEESAESVRDAA